MPRKIKKTLKARQRQKQRQRQRQSVVVNVNTTRSKRARRRLAASRQGVPQTLIHPQMRYSSEPAVYTTHVRGNAPPLTSSRQEGSKAVDDVRAAVADAKASRDSIVAAQAVFRNEMAKAAEERRRQFNAGGMRGVGQEFDLNPDRGAAVAESAAGAAMVNPDAGYTELPAAVDGPPYEPDEGVEDEDEEKDEGPQQEAKSSGGFGRRLRKAVGDFVGSMSPGRRPTARVVPVSDAHAIRHKREIAIAFSPPDLNVDEFNAAHADVPMAEIPSSRAQRANARAQDASDAMRFLTSGGSPFDLNVTTLRLVAQGLNIRGRTAMSREELVPAVQQALDRKGGK